MEILVVLAEASDHYWRLVLVECLCSLPRFYRHLQDDGKQPVQRLPQRVLTEDEQSMAPPRLCAVNANEAKPLRGSSMRPYDSTEINRSIAYGHARACTRTRTRAALAHLNTDPGSVQKTGGALGSAPQPAAAGARARTSPSAIGWQLPTEGFHSSPRGSEPRPVPTRGAAGGGAAGRTGRPRRPGRGAPPPPSPPRPRGRPKVTGAGPGLGLRPGPAVRPQSDDSGETFQNRLKTHRGGGARRADARPGPASPRRGRHAGARRRPRRPSPAPRASPCRGAGKGRRPPPPPPPPPPAGKSLLGCNPARARGGRRAAPPHAPRRWHFLPPAGNPRRPPARARRAAAPPRPRPGARAPEPREPERGPRAAPPPSARPRLLLRAPGSALAAGLNDGSAGARGAPGPSRPPPPSRSKSHEGRVDPRSRGHARAHSGWRRLPPGARAARGLMCARLPPCRPRGLRPAAPRRASAGCTRLRRGRPARGPGWAAAWPRSLLRGLEGLLGPVRIGPTVARSRGSQPARPPETPPPGHPCLLQGYPVARGPAPRGQRGPLRTRHARTPPARRVGPTPGRRRPGRTRPPGVHRRRDDPAPETGAEPPSHGPGPSAQAPARPRSRHAGAQAPAPVHLPPCAGHTGEQPNSGRLPTPGRTVWGSLQMDHGEEGAKTPPPARKGAFHFLPKRQLESLVREQIRRIRSSHLPRGRRRPPPARLPPGPGPRPPPPAPSSSPPAEPCGPGGAAERKLAPRPARALRAGPLAAAGLVAGQP
ncbi:basic proline-rich protein-like [Dipodomys spectabilis]|uniref:basic proline-rich protein-like n=1 Tax=Dipodomys spectabilis TaxID=105255 RepID=UPI001C5408DF|nr:basic proline-rich protein-like [Dipodomys spectabilis]